MPNVEAGCRVMLRRAILGLLVISAFLSSSTLSSAGGARLTEREAAFLKEINAVRSSHGLAPLRLDFSLEQAARSHSGYMLRTGSFAHGNFGGRMAQFRVRASLAGENLAWGAGSLAAPSSVVAAWLGSAEHRANLLRPAFRRIGVGAAIGPFLGYPGATVVTADFAG
jgi:uncharacterized protein YkwD